MGQTQDHDVEVVRVIPQERISERINEQIVGVPVPEIMEEIDGVVKFVPQGRLKEHVVEQVVDVQVRQRWFAPNVFVRGLRNRWMFPYLKLWSKSLTTLFHK